MKKIIHTILFLLFLCPIIMAQNTKIEGYVYDHDDDMPLVGANVYIETKNKGTVTDFNGYFSIEIEMGDTLLFSYTGYQEEEVIIKNFEPLVIRLNSGIVCFPELVVTALGLKRDKKALGYSIESLQTGDIQEVKSINFLDNLTGKFSGVQINHGATGVGSSSKIIIRGETSFTNNNPLFVIDGIPINNNTDFNITNEAAAGFQEVDFGNGIMDLHPDDIESVSVLKGPSAAALYGTRASNGVIVIETKNGLNNNDFLGISFSSSLYIDKAFRLPKFQNKYGQGNNGEFEYVDGLGGGTNDNITYSYGPELDAGISIPQYDSPVTLADGTTVRGGDTQIHGGEDIAPTPFVSHPNNLKNFYQTGVTNIQHLAIQGGNKNSDFRFSFSNLNSEAIIPGVDYNRKNVFSKLNFQPNEKLKINTSLQYIYSKSNNRPGSGYGSENMNYALVAWMGRQTNLNPMKDYWQPGLENVQQYSYNYTFFDNPYFTLYENRNSFDRNRLMGMIALNYEIIPSLNFSFRTGMDYSSELRKFRRAFSTNRFKNGAYAEHELSYREMNYDASLNYEKKIDDFSFDLTIGINRLDQKSDNEQIQALALAQPGVFNFSNAAVPLESFVFSGKKRINSIYSLLKLGYKDMVYLDITGRNDGSSALANVNNSKNTSFFYPSFSSSFIVSNMLSLPSSFSFLKLRASWAQVGNDTQPYQTSNVYESQTPFGGLPTLSNQNFIANENLLPEKTTAFEIGMDARWWEDRIRLDATFYSSETKNQILSLPIAQSTGYNQQVVNGGVIQSKGMEVLLELMPVIHQDFFWKSQFNFSRNVSKLTSLPEGVEQIALGYNRVYDNVNQTVWIIASEGSRIGDIWGTGYLKNENGDFIIGSDGKYIVDNSLKKLGNYNPDFMLGWRNEFKFKNVKIGMVWDWRQGGEMVSRTQALAGVAGQLIETENRPVEGIVAQGVQNIGTTENPNYVQNTTAISAESYYRQFYDRNHEENNVLDASFLKWREFSLTYTLPRNLKFISWSKKISISLIGKNILAISKIKHFDPEQMAVQGNGFVGGVEDMSYSSTRSFGISFNVDF